MCTASQNHCPTCCTNYGEVYSRPCAVLYQLRPHQQGFAQINHPIDIRNPKIALETCDRCQRGGQKHSWLGKLFSLSLAFRNKASEHTPCEICQNSLSPIFSVLICTSRALSALLRSVRTCKTFLVGAGVCLYTPCLALSGPARLPALVACFCSNLRSF